MRALHTDSMLDPSRTRADVVAARSRMRTKHGGRLAIAWLNDRLEDDEVVTHLARTRAVAGSATCGPGVVALTERHLVYVPDSLVVTDVIRVPLDTVVAVGWTRARRDGDLTVATRRSAWELRHVASGDLRELVEALAERVPDADHVQTLPPLLDVSAGVSRPR